MNSHQCRNISTLTCVQYTLNLHNVWYMYIHIPSFPGAFQLWARFSAFLHAVSHICLQVAHPHHFPSPGLRVFQVKITHHPYYTIPKFSRFFSRWMMVFRCSFVYCVPGFWAPGFCTDDWSFITFVVPWLLSTSISISSSVLIDPRLPKIFIIVHNMFLCQRAWPGLFSYNLLYCLTTQSLASNARSSCAFSPMKPQAAASPISPLVPPQLLQHMPSSWASSGI